MLLIHYLLYVRTGKVDSFFFDIPILAALHTVILIGVGGANLGILLVL
jgi:hypothetical protein